MEYIDITSDGWAYRRLSDIVDGLDELRKRLDTQNKELHEIAQLMSTQNELTQRLLSLAVVTGQAWMAEWAEYLGIPWPTEIHVDLAA